MLDEGLLSIN